MDHEAIHRGRFELRIYNLKMNLNLRWEQRGP